MSGEIGLGNLCSFPQASKRSAFRYPSAIRRATTRRTKSPHRPSSRSAAPVERLTPTHTARVVHNLGARRDPFVRLGKMMSLASTAASVPVTRASGARPRAQRNAGNGPAPKVREAVTQPRRRCPALAFSSRRHPADRTRGGLPGRYPVDREFRDAPSMDAIEIERGVDGTDPPEDGRPTSHNSTLTSILSPPTFSYI